MYNEFDGEYRFVPGGETPEQTSSGPSGKKTKSSKWIALALCCSLLGGIVGTAGTLVITGLTRDEAPAADTSTILAGQRENAVINVTNIETGKLMTAAEVYASNVNATVGITTAITTNFWGYQTTSAASGSGFIFTDDGYILTNYHVIEDSDSITVSLYNGTTYDAELVGYDQSNDIAVLKVDAQGLTPVILGDSDNLNVGDSVVAIGNPLGELTFSLTAGTISAKDREITMSNGAAMQLFQTDCAINSGNSGGALFNLYGEVIGITNAKYSNSSTSGASIDNIGFAIPINDARAIATSIIEKGYVSKPYIGISVADVTPEIQGYGLPQGAAVRGVTDGSPAQKAGLQVNDIVTEANGIAITGSSDLVRLVKEAQIGDTLTLSVYRQGNVLEITITVGEQIQSAQPETNNAPQSNSQTPNPFAG